MLRYFSSHAISQLRQAIAEAAGNEVFFLGKTDALRQVIEVEPLARGSRDAVPAILVTVSFGDVVIHNHPSGELTPSVADLEIASLVGNQGVGFSIIDNAVERCYQVVAPFEQRQTTPISHPELETVFKEQGVLARTLTGYEYRQEQLRMAFNVADAFNGNQVAMVEAGTGTGKSLAYLVPAIYWAVRNQERVVISTNTINLQEQLIKKDIPFLRQQLGVEFRAILVKGRSNYLCLRKLAAATAEPTLFGDDLQQELETIRAWSATTSDGCRSDLSFVPQDDVWQELSCEADQCNRVKCPFYGRCFFYRARREASTADILVVNHALLMTDVALRRQTGNSTAAVLPPFQRLICDEAHHLEGVATNFLAGQVSRQALLHVMGRLQHPRKPQVGVLPRLSTQLSREVPEEFDDLYQELAALLEGELLGRRVTLADQLGRGMDAIALAMGQQTKGSRGEGERKLRITEKEYATDFWQRCEEVARELAAALNNYAELVRRFLRGCEKLPEEVQERLAGNLVDLKGIRSRLAAAAEQLLFFVGRDDEQCRWLELRQGKKGSVVRLCTAPLDVAQALRDSLFNRFPTVILTSATLAVGDSFDYLTERTGVALLPPERVTRLILASPFDYEQQALVAIPADLPGPTEPGFADALRKLLPEMLRISQGRAFLLFTSFDLLSRLHAAMAPELRRQGMTPLRQGEMTRHQLLSRFRQEKNAVLFGTDSFWEGVDVQGRALELVVITRLPFRVPTEPILQARAEQIEAHGGDPFMEYTVPQAVIRFKQGFGRLIRSRDDRGAVVICDSRVLNRGYGRRFLDSLPPVATIKGDSPAVLAKLREFFKEQ